MKWNVKLLVKPLPAWLSALIIGGALAAVWWMERRRPLRRPTEEARVHDARNAIVAVLSMVAIAVTERPLTAWLTQLVHDTRWGIVKSVPLPAPLELFAAVILLDYTLYVWHVLTHRVPFLWRFHRVHHSDLDLTASTALRFHFVEMVLSVPWRALQVLLIGASPLALSAWQTATLSAILFHHSNVKLPIRLERWLCRIFMTPRMHGIHHSIVEQETNSNWSTIFAWPDYLHGTYRLNVPQNEVTIGVPEYRDPGELDLATVVTMPFGAQRAPWLLPGDGKPERPSLPTLPRSVLAS